MKRRKKSGKKWLVVNFWTRRKSPYLIRKNESNEQQRRLGEVLCGVPERVGAAWNDDAGVLRQEQRSLHGDGVLCP